MNRRYWAPLALLFVSSSSFAQSGSDFGYFETNRNPDRYQSDRSGALEVRAGQFSPDVDDTPGLSGTPYETFFGSKQRWLVAVEGDWQVLTIPYVGTLGPMGSFGYSYMKGKTVDVTTGERTNQVSKLVVMPATAGAVFRLDALQRDLGVPFGFYAKVALNWTFWNVSNGLGGVSVDETTSTRGKGSSYGYQVAGGLMFLLDFLDPSSAKSMDTSVGVNNTWLIGEVFHSDADSFGKSMQVGDTNWSAGLLFEF